MIKLIASDIDGTLIPEGETKLNPEIFDIIYKLQEHNIEFVVASGRQLESQQLLFAPVADNISYISENGAICTHRGQQYVITEFDRDLAMRILDEVEKRPNCKVTVSCPSTQYIKTGNEKFKNHMCNFLKYNITAVDSLQEIDEPIVKIAFLDSETHSESFEHFHNMFKDEIKVVTAGNSWIDFVPFGSSKAAGLKFLLEKLELTPENAMSFGDQQNDIEMLEYSGTSYAMAHANPDIRKRATNITDSVEKTLQEFIKTLED